MLCNAFEGIEEIWLMTTSTENSVRISNWIFTLVH